MSGRGLGTGLWLVDTRPGPPAWPGSVALAVLLATVVGAAIPVAAEKLVPVPLDSAGARFGEAVAIDGDTMVVGSWPDDANGYDSGAAWVFQRDRGGLDAWGEVAKLTAADGAAGDRFGSAVAISGDTIVVGTADSGATYLFDRHQGGADAWDQVARITPLDDFAFGDSVAIDGDTVAVTGERRLGDYQYETVVAVYSRDQGGAGQWGMVTVAEVCECCSSIDSVAIDGNTIVVGLASEVWTNAAFVLSRDLGGPDAWGLVKRIVPDGSLESFGTSVAYNHQRLSGFRASR